MRSPPPKRQKYRERSSDPLTLHCAAPGMCAPGIAATKSAFEIPIRGTAKTAVASTILQEYVDSPPRSLNNKQASFIVDKQV